MFVTTNPRRHLLYLWANMDEIHIKVTNTRVWFHCLFQDADSINIHNKAKNIKRCYNKQAQTLRC